jgi:filamentous hemagglutinin
MAQLTIVTTPQNSGDGTPLATAFNFCNSNFSELYSRVQTVPPATLVGQVGDTAGMYAYDDTFFYYCFADFDGSSICWGEIAQAGNITVTSIARGNSNVSIGDLGANITTGVGGVANVVVVTPTGQLVQGTVSATGNVQAAFILGNGSQLTGLPATYSNANVQAFLPTYSGNITAGNVLVSSEVSATGNVTGGNIVSSGLISTVGNVAAQGVISATGNIVTTGVFVGTFQGNVTGNFVIPGANTQVVFNTNGNADATAGMTFDTNGPNLFTVLGTISSQGNVIAGNINTANRVLATGNITGGNLTTAGLITATGNVTGGNVLTAGLISATSTIDSAANITGGNIATGGQVSATGNITGGNLVTGGQVSATGNIRTTGFLFATQDLNVGGNVTATVYTGTSQTVTGNVVAGNLRTTGTVSAVGNITGNFFLGNGRQLTGIDTTSISNGNSNVLVGSSAGNVSINVNGISPIALFTPLGATVVGNLSVTGNVVGAVITATTVSAVGNVITNGNISANSIAMTGNINGINIANNNISAGNISLTGAVYNANSLPNGGTINSPLNAMMAGPITVANGSVFTVQTVLKIV